MESELLLHQLLARAMLDIRIYSLEGKCDIVFDIADLFHNIPLQMARIHRDNGDYLEIIDWLRMRASQKKMINWLNNAIFEETNSQVTN